MVYRPVLHRGKTLSTGEIILYRNDAKPRQRSAHGSRFKVSFRKPPKGR